MTERVLPHLSSSQDRRDQGPNKALAQSIVEKPDDAVIAQLFLVLEGAKMPARVDAAMVIDDIATKRPDLIAPHIEKLFAQLGAKHNRIVWGMISTLMALTPLKPEAIMAHLEQIIDATDGSSVVAKDRFMQILAHLNSHDTYQATITPIILHRLRYAAVNQTPMYAEAVAKTISAQDWPEFAAIVELRRDEISYPAKKKRLQKILDSGATKSGNAR